MAKKTRPPKGRWGGPRPGAGRKPGQQLALPGVEAPKVPAEARRSSPDMRAALRLMADSAELGRRRRRAPHLNPFQFPAFPPIAVPKDKGAAMAMDQSPGFGWASSAWAGAQLRSAASEGQVFPGYSFLAELAQRPEYRTISETIADDATRRWIDFDVVGGKDEDKDKARGQENRDRMEARGPGEADRVGAQAADRDPALEGELLRRLQDEQREGEPDPAEERGRREDRVKRSGKMDKVKALRDEMERLEVRDRFYCMARDDGFFGRSHPFLDFGKDSPDELLTPVGDGRDELSRGKVGKGDFKSIKVVEPVWVYPTFYNATDPLAADWYNPQQWYVLGKQVHTSRMPPMIARPVPDLLKPSYAFGGISLSQLAMPYVDIWLVTRESIGSLIHSFSVMCLGTDVQTILAPGGSGQDGLLARVASFNSLRDNQGCFVYNKETEEFKNVSASLAGLHELQGQAQEHMASVSRIPLVKLTGISPSGLNASSEGEIRAYYDTVAAYQNRALRPTLNRIFNFMQLSAFGEIDPEITFEFEPLWEMSEQEKAELQKDRSDTYEKYVNLGAISSEELRGVVIDDPELPFGDLDPEDVPELKQEEMQGLVPAGAGRGLEAVLGTPGGEGGGGGPGPGAGGPGGPPGGQRRPPQPEGGRGGGGAPVIPFRRAADGAADEEVDPLFEMGPEHRDLDWEAEEGDAADAGPPDERRDEGGKWTSGGGAVGSKGAAGLPYGHEHQSFKAPQLGLPFGPAHPSSHGYWAPPPPPKPLDPRKLKRVGPQMGSNPGGVFEDEQGQRWYVKKGKSPDHVRNELTAAALYDLAGAPTMDYRDVAGGGHVASKMAKLDKSNANQLDEDEVDNARRDFAAHAWLANWDAVGLGGDNLVVVKGKPTPVDLGGALDYRAQGAPKGASFGTKVGELDSLRDPEVNPDSAKVFGGITPAQLRESAQRVTDVADDEIREAVEAGGGKKELADKLIARRDDVARRARTFGAEGDPKKATSTVVFPAGDALPAKALNGKAFKEWTPPADGDWNDVGGQVDIPGEEALPEHLKGKSLASGLVIREPDGRAWMTRPKDAFGGYIHSFPKGRVEPALSLQANAIKEAFEETGLKGRIVGLLGDHQGDVTMTRYYLAEREAGDPSKPGGESDGVVLAPVGKLGGFLNRKRDREIAAELAGDSMAADAAPEWSFAGDYDPGEARVPSGEKGGGRWTSGAEGGGSSKVAALETHGDFQEAVNRIDEEADKNATPYNKTAEAKIKAAIRHGVPHDDGLLVGNLSDKELENVNEKYGGIENAHKVLSAEPDTTDKLNALSDEFNEWLDKESLPHQSAGDLLASGTLSPEQAAHVSDFSAKWDAAAKADVEAKQTSPAAAPASEPGKKTKFGGLWKVAGPQATEEENVKLNAALLQQKEVGAGQSYRQMLAYLINNGAAAGVPQEQIDGLKTKLVGALLQAQDKFIGAGKPGDATKLQGALNKIQAADPALFDAALAAHSGKAAPAAATELFAGPKTADSYAHALSKFSLVINVGPPADVAAKKLALAAKYGATGVQLIDSLSVAENQALKEKHGSILEALSKAQAGQAAPKLQPPAPAAPPKPGKPSDVQKFAPAFHAAVQGINEQHKVSSKLSAKKKVKAAVQHGATLDALKIMLKPAEQAKLAKMYGSVDQAFQTHTTWYGTPAQKEAVAAPAQQAASMAAATAHAGDPTDAELAKAKKTVALQLQYVPNAPSTPEAQKLVDEFNAKWASKEVPDDAAAKAKIADFKAMQAKMVPLMTEAQKQAKAQQEAAAKQAAENAAKAKAEAEKSAEAAKAQNAEYMKGLGVTEAEAKGFAGLVQMMGGTHQKELVKQFQQQAHQSKALAHGLTGFEGALIENYKGSSSFINSEMRKPMASWGSQQWAYSKVLNSALSKLPKYKGTVIRNTGLSADLQARYKPGNIVMEHGFTGASDVKPEGVFSGNTRFYINAIGSRAASIKDMYGFGGEGEVLFQARTPFHVDKVEGTIGGGGNATYKVYLTEIEP